MRCDQTQRDDESGASARRVSSLARVLLDSLDRLDRSLAKQQRSIEQDEAAKGRDPGRACGLY